MLRSNDSPTKENRCQRGDGDRDGTPNMCRNIIFIHTIIIYNFEKRRYTCDSMTYKVTKAVFLVPGGRVKALLGQVESPQPRHRDQTRNEFPVGICQFGW